MAKRDDIKRQKDSQSNLRESILEYAWGEFVRMGLKKVKVDDLADHFSISKRTLYEIYEDKETLLYQGIMKYDHEKKELMRQYAASHNVMDVILHAYRQKVEETQQVCTQFYLDIQKYPRVVEYIKKDRENTSIYFLEFLLRGVKEGYFREDVNYDLLPHLFDAVGRYLADMQLFEKYDFKELFRALLLVPLRGFCTQKGLQVLVKAEF